MKKLIVLLMVAAITGAVAFAQDAPAAPTVAFSGNVGAGLLIGTGNKKSDLSFYDYNNGSSGVRFNLNGIVDGGNYGIKFGLNTSVANIATPNIAFNETLGWVYVADKLVKLSVGNLDDGQFSTYVDGDFSWDNGPTWGAEAVVNPIPGLSFGWLVPYSAGTTLPANTPVTVKNSVGLSQFAVTFTAADVVGLKAGYALSQTDGNSGNLWAGASLLAVKGLTLAADLEIVGLGSDAVLDVNTTGQQIKIWENLAYNLGIITPAVLSEQVLGSSDLASIRIQPSVTFNLSGLTPAVVAVIETNSDNGYDALAWDIRPNVSIPVGPKAKVYTGVDVFSGADKNVGNNDAQNDLNGGQPIVASSGNVGFDFFFETEVSF